MPDFVGNSSTLGSAPVMEYYILNIFLAVVLNTLVLGVIYCQTEIQDVMRIIFQLLATLNLFLGIWWNAWSIQWYFFNDAKTCDLTSRIFPFIFRATVMLIMFCICAMNFILYILVSKPLKFYRIVTVPKFRIALVVGSLLTFLSCLVFLPISEWPFLDIHIQECIGAMIKFTANWPNVMKKTFVCIPIVSTLIFTIVIQIAILRIVQKQTKAAADFELHYDVGADTVPVPRNRLPKRTRILRLHKRYKGFVTVSLLTGSFLFIWAPYFFFHLTNDHLLFDMLAASGTWIQPIVYLMTNAEARGVIRALLSTVNSKCRDCK